MPEKGRVVVKPDGRMIALPDMPGMFAEFEAAPRRERQAEGLGATAIARRLKTGHASVCRVLGTPGAKDGPGPGAAAC